jgi:membrane fusion protein (multidrug efflux system)
VLVPEAAVVPFGGRILVTKVVDGRATPQPVTLGIRRDGLVQITEGLREGDVVITAGQMKAAPGTPVAVMPPGAAQGGSAQGGALSQRPAGG